MSDVIARLAEKEKKIRELQQKKAKQDGQRDQIMTQLKSDFGVDSLDAACDLLSANQLEMEKNNVKLDNLDRQMGEIIHSATTKTTE